MLQISNIDDGRSEWNINETHIIIPMIDGDVTNKESDKILTSTLTLNSLEGGEQAILTNALEHSLVIGLDKNLFETPNYKSDLVIIQNSDLKLLSCNSDLKNQVAYTLSYVEQDKSEILWQSPISKDKICASDKAILEVRDVLNYDDSVHELEKNEQQINIDSIDSDITSQVTKAGSEILSEDAVPETKKESQLFNYYTSSQCSEPDPILPHLDASKFINNVQSLETKKVFENESHSSTFKLGKDVQKNILNITESVMEINESMPIKLIEHVKQKTEKKEKSITNKNTKDEKVEGKTKREGAHNFLPEKSLPLKKKAKMKRTLISYSSENRASLLKQDGISTNHVNIKCSTERKIKKPLTTTNFNEEEASCNSSSNKPLIKKGLKRKKTTKLKTNPNKVQKSVSELLVKEDESESNSVTNDSCVGKPSMKFNFCHFDTTKFNNIYDLVESLRKCRLINATIWQTLNSGLKEMKVDILKEMNAKINETYSPDTTHYSPQLKAFALVLYFKQPAAFNHLSQVYKTGWPSLNVIKEWKRRMNSHQRPDFIRAERPIKTNPN